MLVVPAALPLSHFRQITFDRTKNGAAAIRGRMATAGVNRRFAESRRGRKPPEALSRRGHPQVHGTATAVASGNQAAAHGPLAGLPKSNKSII